MKSLNGHTGREEKAGKTSGTSRPAVNMISLCSTLSVPLMNDLTVLVTAQEGLMLSDNIWL